MAFFMRNWEEQTYALMRIISGYVLLWHGTQKLFNIPPSEHAASGYILWVAGPIELIGGILVMIGLFTRPAAFICSGFAAAAYWIAHGSLDALPASALLPITNGGDLAVLMTFVYLYISARGGGIWSVDNARSD
ncbi:MAG TPA: DoxX family protein [Woeseiaceae bacterium]|nr:DoxX family protein [Woeseiaceae bacterium]